VYIGNNIAYTREMLKMMATTTGPEQDGVREGERDYVSLRSEISKIALISPQTIAVFTQMSVITNVYCHFVLHFR